jgi:hypothetical protein
MHWPFESAINLFPDWTIEVRRTLDLIADRPPRNAPRCAIQAETDAEGPVDIVGSAFHFDPAPSGVAFDHAQIFRAEKLDCGGDFFLGRAILIEELVDGEEIALARRRIPPVFQIVRGWSVGTRPQQHRESNTLTRLDRPYKLGARGERTFAAW